jgi:hypothetical protein
MVDEMKRERAQQILTVHNIVKFKFRISQRIVEKHWHTTWDRHFWNIRKQCFGLWGIFLTSHFACVRATVISILHRWGYKIRVSLCPCWSHGVTVWLHHTAELYMARVFKLAALAAFKHLHNYWERITVLDIMTTYTEVRGMGTIARLYYIWIFYFETSIRQENRTNFKIKKTFHVHGKSTVDHEIPRLWSLSQSQEPIILPYP